MTMNSKWLLCGLATAVSCTALAHCGLDGKGKELMVRSLRGQFDFNLVAIVSQQDSSGGCYDTVKVERSADGKIRHTFLAPLSMQGICSMDDGTHSFIYWPDLKRLVKQDSRPKEEDTAQTVGLAIRNYTFKFEGHCHVAGRKTYCVLAVPVDPALEVRRYFLDSKTAYPLKLETVSPDGQSVIKYETKDVQFPSSIEDGIFSIRTLGEVQQMERRKPSDIDPRQAAAFVGFTPIMPRNLPMGFEVQEVQEDVANDWHALIIRLTDGLVRATLYEWKSQGGRDADVRLFEKNTQATFRGIRLVILADMPDETRRRVLDAFISEAETPAPTFDIVNR